MKFRELIELAKTNPEILDYTLNLSDYMVYPDGSEDIDTVADFPIRGIATNEEEKEIRFILARSDVYAIEKSRDKILTWIKEQM